MRGSRPGDPPLGRGHHPAHVLQPEALTAWLSLPRTRGVTASRTGDHGREHPAGRLLRSALCPRSRPSLPDQTRDEGPRAYRYIVGQLLELDPSCPVAMYATAKKARQAVIATGSDNAVRHFRTRYAGTLPCCGDTAGRSPCSRARRRPNSWPPWATTSMPTRVWGAAAYR